MNLYVILAALVLAIGAFFYGMNIGKDVKDAEWKTRENSELVQKNGKILELTAKIRKQEADHAAKVAAISSKHLKELRHVQADTKRRLDAVTAGTLRLFDPAGREGGCGDRAGQTGADPGGSPGGACTELHPESARFLLSLAGEADEVVLQLQACQQVLLSDRQ